MSAKTFAFIALAALFATPALSQSDSSVVATVAGRKITLGEFNRRFEQNSQLVPGSAPSKSEVLKNIVYFELATSEARRLNVHQDPALREQFDILLYQAVVRRFIQPKIDSLDVSEKEVRAYYNDNPLIRTSHIIFLTKPGASEAERRSLRKRAEETLKLVRAGKTPFKDLARKYSEGPSAKTGGDVDWGARHKLLPEYYEAALALRKTGDVSGVVETPYGFHIIKLTGKRSFSKIDSVYRDFIIRTIRENKGQKIFADYFEGLKKRYNVVVNEELIK